MPEEQTSCVPQSSVRTMSRNPRVDLLRLVAISFIIILHIDLRDFGIPAAAMRMAAQWAVPFFFIISGYFAAGSNLSVFDPKRRRTLKRLASFVILGNLLYAPYFYQETARHWQAGIPSLICRLITKGTAFHLWFLHDLLWGQFIISILPKRRHACLLAIALGIAIPFLNAHVGALRADGFWSTILSLGQGIPFLALGIFMRAANFRPEIGWIAVIVGGLTQLIQFCSEIQTDWQSAYGTNLFLGTEMLAFGITVLAVFKPTQENTGNLSSLSPEKSGIFRRMLHGLSHIGESYVLGVYLIHIYLRIIINGLARATGIYSTSYFRLLSAPLILIGSILTLFLFRAIWAEAWAAKTRKTTIPLCPN